MMKDSYAVNRLARMVFICVPALLAGACSSLSSEPPADTIHVLHIYNDGSMKLNDRDVDPDNVVIYPDGYGGEKAALKMRVPLHPDYYRDTIIVKREAKSGPVVID